MEKNGVALRTGILLDVMTLRNLYLAILTLQNIYFICWPLHARKFYEVLEGNLLNQSISVIDWYVLFLPQLQNQHSGCAAGKKNHPAVFCTGKLLLQNIFLWDNIHYTLYMFFCNSSVLDPNPLGTVKFRSRRTGSVIDWKIDWPNDLLNAPISTFWVGKSAPEAKIFKI